MQVNYGELKDLSLLTRLIRCVSRFLFLWGAQKCVKDVYMFGKRILGIIEVYTFFLHTLLLIADGKREDFN